MHVLKVRRPRPELRPYVRTFVQRNIGRTTSVVVEPTTAQLEQILAFDFGTPVEALYPDGRVQLIDATSVGGAQTSFACHMHLRAGAESFGVFFQPTGFSLLFGIPIYEITIARAILVPLLASRSARFGTRWGKAPHLRIGY